MKIEEILKKSIYELNKNKIEDSAKKARIILAHILGVQKEYLVVHDKEEIAESKENKYNEAICKLKNHIPLQYIINYQEFMKLDFYVDENVLIPRQDTEILVEEVINNCNENVENTYKILDLCAGGGAIGVSLAKYLKNANVICTDISSKALEIARKNACKNDVKNIEFRYSDMFKQIEEKFDIIVSNPPYIKREIIKTLDIQVQNEPYIALDGGNDGLDFYKIIVDEAYKYLNEFGKLYLEIGYDQKEDVVELLRKSGKYNQIYSKKDLYENDRIVCCKI